MIANDYTTTWRGISSCCDWQVIIVRRRSWAFGDREVLVELGYDNARPDESRGQTAARISRKFNVRLHQLVLELVGG